MLGNLELLECKENAKKYRNSRIVRMSLLLSPLNIRSNRGLEQNPKNPCFGVFQVSVAVCLLSEYAPKTTLQVEEKKFIRPPILSEAE